jgi:hypothetical protein
VLHNALIGTAETMKRAVSRWVRVIAAVLLLLALAFLVVLIPRNIKAPNLSETILTSGVVGAIVGFVGVLVAQSLARKRHSEALVQARELEGQRAQEAAVLSQRLFAAPRFADSSVIHPRLVSW